MSDAVWKKAVQSAPVPERVRHALTQLRADAPPMIDAAEAGQARIRSALWSGSEWPVEWLQKHPECLSRLTPQSLAHARRVQGLAREIDEWLVAALAASDGASALAKLRQ